MPAKKIKIGNLELGNLPVVVGTVCTELKLHSKAIERVDVFEIRIDMLKYESIPDIFKVISSIKHRYQKPLIATIRSKKEGGLRHIDDNERYTIFEKIISLVEMLDIELSSTKLIEKVSQLCKKNKKPLMASYHNFNETPDKKDLKKLLEQSRKYNTSIFKIAVQANTKKDLAHLINFTIENKDAGLVTISLGAIGLVSRIVNPMIGSLMTYGYVDRVAALGQLSVFDVIDYIRLFDSAYNEKLIEKTKLLQAV